MKFIIKAKSLIIKNMDKRIKIIKGDIVEMKVEAIVNAANETLLGGGGVDGAIHRAAGHKLLEECMSLEGCETGKAKITLGYKLHSKYVIHAVGPIWQGGNNEEDLYLRDAYINSLRLSKFYNIKTIAFPAISTGSYKFPIDRAAKISLNAINEFLIGDDNIEEVYIVCYTDEVYDSYIAIESEI